MWIESIEFPRELIEAHRLGELVIFVGAGASIDPPSSLPTFKELTHRILQRAQADTAALEGESPRLDVILQELDDNRVDVHHLVASIIDEPSSAPNPLHHALAALADGALSVRVVTTNYDEHLSTAIRGRRSDVPEYRAPALPMGDDLEGIVYLHGSIKQPSRYLVVTESDFGRAYLLDAWAARFLERMFRRYTVLFVGYSHDDLVMRYLSRSLGSNTARYIMTDKPDAPHWQQLGLRPLGYPRDGDSHAALPTALRRWADMASWGMLEHRQHAQELLAVPPSDVPEERSFVEELLESADRVQFFTGFARHREWLQWAADQQAFQAIFAEDARESERTQLLARWFVEHFALREQTIDEALLLLRQAGGRLSPALADELGLALHRADKPRAPWHRAWLLLLLESEQAPSVRTEWLEYALKDSKPPSDLPLALLLFDRLTEPRRRLDGSRFGALPRIVVAGSSHWIDEAWTKVLRPHLPDVAPQILSMADRHLRRAHQLNRAVDHEQEWCPVSSWRSSIEPNALDEARQPLDPLIDAARDSLASLLDDTPASAAAYMDVWADSEVLILRRLAIHGWSRRKDVDSATRLSWVQERGWLYDGHLRPEVFELIATAVPDATTQSVKELVDEAMAGPPEADPADERVAYERFNLVAWIRRHAASSGAVESAYAQLTEQHPHFGEREHPDPTSYVETGWVEPHPPMALEELHTRILSDPEGAMGELEACRQGNRFRGEPSWHDALTLLTDTVTAHPADGEAVLDVASAESEIVGAVLRGWSAAQLDAEMAKRLVDQMGQLQLGDVADDISQLLSDGGRNPSRPTKWYRLESARELARRVWDALPSGPVREAGPPGWLGAAVNHPAGHLALFWMRVVSSDWNQAPEAWQGLPPPLRHELERHLSSADSRAALAETVYASQVRLLHGADAEWCEEHILPLLDWTDPARAERAWDGFLYWGRPTNRLLAAGLLDHYLDAVEHEERLDDEPRHQLYRHIAGIALSSDRDPESWLVRFDRIANEDQRVAWLDAVSWMLRDLETEQAEQQWDRWMRSYWRQRLDSIPTQLTAAEASALAGWVPRLKDSLGEAVDLAVARPAGLDEHARLLDLIDDDVIRREPAALVTLVTHLLRGTDRPFWDCHRLREFVQQVRTADVTTSVEGLASEALRLGCSDAADW